MRCRSPTRSSTQRTVDGAGEWRIYRSVVFPLLRPILVTLGVFTFMATWNDFMWPLVALIDGDLRTLPVALAILSGEHVQDTELMMAGSVVTLLPVLLLFVLVQRYYVAGIVAGSLKGIVHRAKDSLFWCPLATLSRRALKMLSVFISRYSFHVERSGHGSMKSVAADSSRTTRLARS